MGIGPRINSQMNEKDVEVTQEQNSKQQKSGNGSFYPGGIFKKLIFLLVAGIVAFGVAIYFGDQIPQVMNGPLSKAKSAAFETGPIGKSIGQYMPIPSNIQVPLLAAVGVIALLILLFAIRFTVQRPKTVGGLMALAAVTIGYVFYFGDIAPSFPEVDKKLASLVKLQQPAAQKPTEIGVTKSETSDSIVTTKKYKAAAEYNELLVLDPSTDVIYPGALIMGETIATGEYTPIVVDRRPITISASLENVEGNISRKIQKPTLSTVREAVKEIVNSKVTGSTAARTSFEIKEVYSSEQMGLAIGANYKYSAGVSASIEGGFNFNSSNNKSRYIVKYIQSYYTIDMDSPKNPSEVFSNPDELNVTMLGSVSPMYVSTVNYGRMALFTVESDASSMELGAALKATVEAGTHSGGAEIKGDYARTLRNSTIKGTVIGGSGATAAKAIIGVKGMREYLTSGGDWGKDSPAAPLSYKLRYLSDNSVGNVVMATEYNVRNVTKITSKVKKFRVTVQKIYCKKANDGAGSAIELYGKVDLLVRKYKGSSNSPEDQSHNIWSKDEWNWIRVGTGGDIPLNKEVIIELDDYDLSRSFVELGCSFTEEDTGPDSYMGSDKKKIFLNRPESSTLTCTSDEGTVNVMFMVQPMQ